MLNLYYVSGIPQGCQVLIVHNGFILGSIPYLRITFSQISSRELFLLREFDLSTRLRS